MRLDALQRGDANSALALDWAMQIAIWNQVAERLGRGQAEMAPVLTLGFLLAQRARDTGRWCLQGADEYEMARQAVLIMDQLARLIDRDLLQGEREALQQTREALGLYSSQRPPIELARGLK